jgi:hypothetical protein
VLKALLVPSVLPVRQALKELRVSQAPLAQSVPLERKVLKALPVPSALPVQQVLKVHRDSQAPKVLKAPLDRKVHKDPRDP